MTASGPFRTCRAGWLMPAFGGKTDIGSNGPYAVSKTGARDAIPLRLKQLRGNPGHQKLRPQPEPTIAASCPEPPPISFRSPRHRRHRDPSHETGKLEKK